MRLRSFLFTFTALRTSWDRSHIRQYQAHVFGKLRKPWSIAETPYPKKVQRLPIILSQEEVTQLIDSARTPFHRILLMTLYATGVRRAELARLKITDIDTGE